LICDRVRLDEVDRFEKSGKEGAASVSWTWAAGGRQGISSASNQNTGTNNGDWKKLLSRRKKSKWFRDARFRQAIASAIDREAHRPGSLLETAAAPGP